MLQGLIFWRGRKEGKGKQPDVGTKVSVEHTGGKKLFPFAPLSFPVAITTTDLIFVEVEMDFCCGLLGGKIQLFYFSVVHL